MSDLPRRAILRSPERGSDWWAFENSVAGGVARVASEVPALLESVESASQEGLWAVGYVRYEAAPAFDPALTTSNPTSRALAAFAFFRSPSPVEAPRSSDSTARIEGLAPAISSARHAIAVEAIRAAIAAGETYQVNFTFPFRGRFQGDAEALFWRLSAAGEAPCAAFLEMSNEAVVSLSPELFFELEGERIRMRPMKGTRRRGRFGEEDGELAAELAGSAKDRAENLMIVDMARNDLGRIAHAGTVRVSSLYDLERYATVWQMTSTVEARTVAALPEIFAALFPCASVTGAPKPRAMRWIGRLESAPRDLYCGTIGWVAPSSAGRRARFSVAIRTAILDRARGEVTYGVGSGIVWDSVAAAEYDECLAKARALDDPGAPIALVETMRWTPTLGVRFFEAHLSRLAASADYFAIPFRAEELRGAVVSALSRLPRAAHRIRLQLESDGTPSVSSEPWKDERRTWRAIVAAAPVPSASPYLFHKTTRREPYDRALAEARAQGADEAILWNEREELTEGSRTNLVLRLHGRWRTPARDSGLLNGVLRGYLLRKGWIEEAVLRKEDLYRAEQIAVISSLRGGVRVELA